MLKRNFVILFIVGLLLPISIQPSTIDLEINIIEGKRSLKSVQKDISKIKKYINKQYKKSTKKRAMKTPVVLNDSLSFKLIIDKSGNIIAICSYRSTVDDLTFHNDIHEYIDNIKFSPSNDTSVVDISLSVQYEKKKKDHEFSFDIHSYTVKDNAFSPLFYGGKVFGGTYHSITTGCNSIRTSYNSLSYGNIKSDISHRSFGYLHIDGQEDYYRLVFSKNNKFKIYVGGLFESYLDLLLDDIPTWTNAYSLNISCFLNYRIDEKKNIYLKTYSPFLTYSNRPPWGLFDDEILDMSILEFLIRGKFTSVNTYRKLSCQLRYCYAFNRKISGFAGFDFHYLYVSEPLVLKSVLGKFRFGLIL
jgi:hypothetical protein